MSTGTRISSVLFGAAAQGAAREPTSRLGHRICKSVSPARSHFLVSLRALSRFRHIILYTAVMAPDGYATGTPCESRMKAVFERLTSKGGNRLHLLPAHRSLRMMTYRSGTHRIARTSIGVSIMITLSQEKRIVYLSDSGRSPRRRRQSCVAYCTQKPTDDGWSTPYGSPPTPPGLPSSPRSSWRPCTNSNIVQRYLGIPLLSARTTQRISNAEAGHRRGHTSYSVWFLHHNGYFYLVRDIEILTLFNDDISSIRDDCTAWVTADPSTFRVRHMTNKGIAAPLFWDAFENRVFLHHLGTGFPSSPNQLLERTRIGILSWNPRTSTRNARSNRETHRREMAHYRVTRCNRVPSARFAHEQFPRSPHHSDCASTKIPSIRTFRLAQSTSMTQKMGCSKLCGKVRQVGFFWLPYHVQHSGEFLAIVHLLRHDVAPH